MYFVISVDYETNFNLKWYTADHCLRSNGETVLKVIRWTPKHGTKEPERLQLTYINIVRLRQDTGLKRDDRTVVQDRIV